MLIATADHALIGSVEVHSAAFLRQQATTLTVEQAKLLQPYLASLQVHPEWRGQGVGRRLVEAAVQEVRARPDGSDRLMLQVEALNVPATRLYERCGFRRLSHPACKVHLMEMTLSAGDAVHTPAEAEAAG